MLWTLEGLGFRVLRILRRVLGCNILLKNREGAKVQRAKSPQNPKSLKDPKAPKAPPPLNPKPLNPKP